MLAPTDLSSIRSASKMSHKVDDQHIHILEKKPFEVYNPPFKIYQFGGFKSRLQSWRLAVPDPKVILHV